MMQRPVMSSERFHLNKLFATRLCGSAGIDILFWKAKQEVIKKPLESGAMMSMPATPFWNILSPVSCERDRQCQRNEMMNFKKGREKGEKREHHLQRADTRVWHPNTAALPAVRLATLNGCQCLWLPTPCNKR
jgi:hypothetical protein